MGGLAPQRLKAGKAQLHQVAQRQLDAVALEAAEVGVVGELVDVRADLAQLTQQTGYRFMVNRRAVPGVGRRDLQQGMA
ncbi:MAG: hypothetical protein MNPFHGCM_00904 [Gemmatimonadaceae bacterium]|nr:hypothetical protein [Gemmatimonadaceae bacterium]